jgi:hypothetical protein
MRVFPFIMVLPILLCGCADPNDFFDPNDQVHTGEQAKAEIVNWAHSAVRLDARAGGLPPSATNFWLYDGGTFSGMITYWVFDCGSREDCLKAVEYLGDLRAGDLIPWEASRYAVVMEGLDYYTNRSSWKKKLRSNPWNVRGIKNGLVYERTSGKQGGQGGNERMVYYAIDFDKNRVYYHYESGGFPMDEHRPEGPDGRF